MGNKRFGPVLAPGVVVTEKEAGKSVQAAPFGVTGFVGVLEKGEVGKLISCYSLRDFRKKCGARIDSSLVPDAAEDFWNHGNGAGELHLLRVTDGFEQAAFVNLYCRTANSLIYNPSITRDAVIKVVAKNGGRWGGKTRVLAGIAASVTATTITTGLTMRANEWKDAYIRFKNVSNKQYKVTTNTTAGVLYVTSDSNVSTDLGAQTKEYTLELQRDTAMELSVVIGNGEIDPDNLFSMKVYVDAAPVLYYPNLSMDPASKYYFVRLVNDDKNNDEITVTDLNALAGGNYQAYRRPANEYGVTASSGAVTGSVLKIVPYQFWRATASTGTPTLAMNESSLTAAMKYRVLVKITMTSASVANVDVMFLGKRLYDLSGDEWQRIATGVTVTSEFQPLGTAGPLPGFTLASTLVSTDVYYIDFSPMETNALANWTLYPNQTDSQYKNTKFRIVSNTSNTITVSQAIGSTSGNSKEYRIESPSICANGYDGDTPADANYTSVYFDTVMSPFNNLIGQNKGVMRLACPGISTAAVVKAGIAFAEAKNWIYRMDMDKSITTEDAAITYVNTTIGRSEFAVVNFPSFGWVNDPDRAGQLKQISLSGAIMGREAQIAAAYGGYHKAPAGVDVILSRVVKLDTERLNEEVLTPQGINVIKMWKGRCIVWGDRTLSTDSSWSFMHHRVLMSYYEHVLQENFDWTIFQINDSTLQAQIISSLRAFFMPEWQKRALRGDKFENACAIKVDNENNTDLTRSRGEMYAEIGLQLADTVERFVITMSKDGVFEQTA
jgi:phage tail sheath protein FI